MWWRWLTILFCCLAGSSSAQPRLPKIILDTDIGPDYDDVGAMAILHALADKRECEILATISCNTSRYSGPVLSALNTYFNRPRLPIGVIRPPAVDLVAKQKWDSLIVAGYPHTLKSNAAASDATVLYRQLLAKQPDSSVTIVTVGFFSNLSRLLSSPGDAASPLTGLELVSRKVKLLVSMAGRFDADSADFKEFNVVMDAPAASKVINEWPGAILFSGFEIGMKLHTGLPIAMDKQVQRSPVKDVFAHCIPLDPQDKAGRMSWDETAVLVAVRGTDPYFDTISGRATVYDGGKTRWNPQGNDHRYLVMKMKEPVLEQLLNDLIRHQPQQ